ncbi:MAG: thiamine phosphate synthase [Desulfobacterales bacterium]
MRLKHIDYSLYLVTDRRLSRGRSTLEIVTAAVAGGVTCVQLREKAAATREFIEEALKIRDHLRSVNIPLIINDRLDVALAVGAAGVHLGGADMPPAMARAVAGNRMIIGISVESVADARAAEKGGADYLGVSPIFATPTKTDTAPALGTEGLQAIRQAVRLPLVAIGGLNSSNAADIIRCGADGVAVVSAIVSAADPAQAARRLKSVIMEARRT